MDIYRHTTYWLLPIILVGYRPVVQLFTITNIYIPGKWWVFRITSQEEGKGNESTAREDSIGGYLRG